MKKKYITLEEVLELRGTDTKIYCEENEDLYVKFVGDTVCCYDIDDDSIKAIGGSFADRDTLYILEPEEFKVERTGKYKTRDGKDVYVSCVDDSDYAFGVIKGTRYSIEWYKSGKVVVGDKNNLDLVEYVGD